MPASHALAEPLFLEPGRRPQDVPARLVLLTVLGVSLVLGAMPSTDGIWQHSLALPSLPAAGAQNGAARWGRSAAIKPWFRGAARLPAVQTAAFNHNPLRTSAGAGDAHGATQVIDPEVARDPQQKFHLGAPSIFKPYMGEGYRKTEEYTLVQGVMWGFEQSQELISLSVNIRCTVIRLKSGGLWVHSPVFPTDEFLAKLAKIGEVEHIVLPTYALEHKLPMGSFIRRIRTRAKLNTGRMPQVWTVGDTWSFPVNLPLKWLGITVDGLIGRDNLPWADEIDFKILRIADVGNPFIEAQFFHKATQTLIVTDTVYQIPRNPPEVVPTSLLLDVAPDDPKKPLPDTLSTRQRAWAKMALLCAFFIPARQRLVEGGKAEWQDGYMASFEKIAGRLLVSPILQKLVFEKSSPIVREWVKDVSKWPFKRVVPAHYAAPVAASPKDFRRAYAFAFEGEAEAPLPQEDMQTLNDLGEIIKSLGGGWKGSDAVYGRLFDKFFKNLFIEKPGWLKTRAA